MLEDGYGRRFSYLRLSITDVCNFRCSYCLPDGYQCDSDREFLSLKEIANTISAFAGLGTKKIRLTGGEPSLRRDLPDIIALAAATAGITQVAITTNGFKLPHFVEDWFSAGLTSLNVSIDSLDARLFHSITGQDKLHTILDGVHKALALGLKTKVNAVLLKPCGDTQLSSFLEWLKDVPVTLRLIELMQTGSNLEFFKQNHVSALPVKTQLLQQGWVQVLKEETSGPAEEFSHPDYAGRIGLIMPYNPGFCTSCNRLRISALGKLHLCLFAEQGIDLRPVLSSGTIEEIQQQLVDLITQKKISHQLVSGLTGATQQFSMLGG
ncbi:GTP 3',8-cyclase MoaA [Rheinheimera sp. MM224]|uniref:GTP 3',8-cyclase MoaA n=1 Tax=Rheinheimera sp. MM224 TaxID=3019969 RepID=UPI0021F8C18F|nr:GTP 3',8-cyclase MoaA [Rheinheimera sp. MM224]CAI3798337.1 GTP 3',8-cyclase [Rheinheimera sp. MM224]